MTEIISFSGRGMCPLQTPQREFEKTLNRLFPFDEKMFFLDEHNIFYHKGIKNNVTIDEMEADKDHLL